MIRKFLIVVILLGSISLLSASNVDKNNNQVVSLGDGNVMLLQGGATSAFTIVLSSYDVTTTSGAYTIWESSIEVRFSSSSVLGTDGLIGQATYYIDYSTHNVLEQVNNLNTYTGVTSVVSDLCYLFQSSTGNYAEARNNIEGGSFGIRYTDTGIFADVNVLGNNTTHYLNATTYIKQTFPPKRYQEYAVQRIEVNLKDGATMYLYTGDSPTTITTQLVTPVTDVLVKDFPTGLPVPIPTQKYWDYVVNLGSFSTVDSYIQTLYYIFKD